MKNTSVLWVNEYNEYLQFIVECKAKQYPENIVLHKHHIYPKFLKLTCDLSKLIVLLSVNDHAYAHILLSKCFDKGSYEYISNLRAAKILSNKSITDKEMLVELRKSFKGDNNPSKLLENRQKISKGLVEFYSNNQNSKKGKSYKEIYGDRYEEEILKRKKVTRDKQQYKQCAAKSSETKRKNKTSSRANNPNAQKISIDGTIFNCMADACDFYNLSLHMLKKHKNVVYIVK